MTTTKRECVYANLANALAESSTEGVLWALVEAEVTRREVVRQRDSARNWVAFLNEQNSVLEARIADARQAIRSGAASMHDIARILGDNTGDDT